MDPKDRLLLLVRAAVEELKTLSTMDAQLWNVCLRMFRGEVDALAVLDVFIEVIKSQLTKAWNEGARSVGVDPEDMTAADNSKLQAVIESEYNYVLQLIIDVQNAKDSNMQLNTFRGIFHGRIGVWANRYRDTVNAARVWFGGKTKLIWNLGPTDLHCPSCVGLAGIVAWSEEWFSTDVRPQNPVNWALKCGGWGCACSLTPTNLRRTRGALATILGAVGGRVRV